MAEAIVVVMGVTGCGKSTIGPLVARRLGLPYADADAFHPPANRAKMAAGTPLDDADRGPWLAAVADWIGGQAADGRGGVIACSALRRRYRDRLRAATPSVWFLHLAVDRDVVVRRVAARTGHFMPTSLVDSQFAALEPLAADEPGAVLDADGPPARVAAAAVTLLTTAVFPGRRGVRSDHRPSP